ncbi:MAG: heme NO-binding domain-containing protein [Myxococcales bacterium]|nr:heme NO-binding domain-containing protein [Myxococcales bacterium]
MKGIVFTELLSMAEAAFSPELVEEVIIACDLPSGGAYTAIGTYPHSELVALVSELSRRGNTPASELIQGFGKHLFATFLESHAAFFTSAGNTFDLLSRVEDEIHVEVRKLYPDAELPSFTASEPLPGDFVLEYRSSRGLADLAHGLIEASIAHFGENIWFERKDLSEGQNTHVVFTLHRV